MPQHYINRPINAYIRHEVLTVVGRCAVRRGDRERTRIDALYRANFEPVPASRVKVTQRHVQRLDDHRQVLAVRRGVIVYVIVAFVHDALGRIQRRVDPVQADAVRGQRARAQVHGRRKSFSSGLTNCRHTHTTNTPITVNNTRWSK